MNKAIIGVCNTISVLLFNIYTGAPQEAESNFPWIVPCAWWLTTHWCKGELGVGMNNNALYGPRNGYIWVVNI